MPQKGGASAMQYLVVLSGTLPVEASVVVEAKTAEEARSIAVRMAGNLEFHPIDAVSDVCATEVRPVGP
jgi:hypothetical protein